jgi:hypothetical protein
MAQLIAGYQAGTKLRELGTRFCIHPETAGSILRRNGIQMRLKGLRPEQEVEAERLYARGLSPKRVGEQLGVDAEIVRGVLRNHGIQLWDRQGRL